MMNIIFVICGTIIICTLIRYLSIWYCRSAEYKLYRQKNGITERFVIRPWYSDKYEYWGFVVFDTKNNLPFTNSTSLKASCDRFTIFRAKREAKELLDNVNSSFS